MAILKSQGRHFPDSRSSADDPPSCVPRDPAAFNLGLPYVNGQWFARIDTREYPHKNVWLSRPRDTPEAVAYLAKRWYEGKPDITDAAERRRVKNKEKTPDVT